MKIIITLIMIITDICSETAIKVVVVAGADAAAAPRPAVLARIVIQWS